MISADEILETYRAIEARHGTLAEIGIEGISDCVIETAEQLGLDVEDVRDVLRNDLVKGPV